MSVSKASAEKALEKLRLADKLEAGVRRHLCDAASSRPDIAGILRLLDTGQVDLDADTFSALARAIGGDLARKADRLRAEAAELGVEA